MVIIHSYALSHKPTDTVGTLAKKGTRPLLVYLAYVYIYVYYMSNDNIPVD